MRIISIDIKEEPEEYPDLSHLGAYTNKKQKWAIDRDVRRDRERGQYKYFVPANPPAPGMTRKERRDAWTACEAAYERMEGCNKGLWNLQGISAVAEVEIRGVIQRIQSGGLWGIESDSGDDYLETIEAEQKEELRQILREMGFKKRNIRRAFECALYP